MRNALYKLIEVHLVRIYIVVAFLSLMKKMHYRTTSLKKTRCALLKISKKANKNYNVLKRSNIKINTIENILP